MRYIFEFPDIGEGITEGKIVEWYVQKGQAVKTGESVVKMETDKVVTDIPSPKDGVVTAVFGKEGDVINVDDPLIEIEIEGVSGEEAQKVAKEKPKPKSEAPVEEKGYGVVGTIEVAGDGAFLPSSGEGLEVKPETEARAAKKALATPVARAVAKNYGIDINQVKGSGPGGRVMKEDILKYHEKAKSVSPAAPMITENEVEEIPLTQIRKTIAQKMIESKHNAAHMTVIEEVEISKLVALRKQHKEDFIEEGFKLTYLPFVMKAVALALKQFPSINAQMDMENNRMIYKKYYNIGIAVDTEDGLVVPVIRNVDKLSIFEIARQIDIISKKARDRKLTLEDYKDGTFTITNYGSIGGMFGVPVINYPQAGILGVGRILKTPVVNEQDEIVVGHVLPLSMSLDHRIVDGGDASRFINMVMHYLKDPFSLLLK